MSSILLLTLSLMLFLVIAGRKVGLLSPSSLFLYSQYAMAIGILPLLDDGIAADRTHRMLLLFTFISYVTGSLLAVGMMKHGITRGSYVPVVDFGYPVKPVFTCISISIAIGVAYFAAIGYVAFFESFSAIVKGQNEDIAGLRLESYAGSRYLFPGYVNQFKNALLPALLLVVVAASFNQKQSSRWLTAVSLGSVTLILLIGTGQRHPLVKALVLAVVFAYIVFPRMSIRSILAATTIGAPLFVITTFASGRLSNELEAAQSISDKAAIFIEGLFHRLFASSQLSAMVGFRYIYHRDDIAFGSEWVHGLVGLLPGQTGSGLSNEIFDVLFGTTRGTAPPSLWGSAYYNFGFMWTVVLAGLLGFIFALISASFLKRETLNLIQAAGMAGITTTLGLWVTGGPTTILNDGLGAFLLLLWWGDRIHHRNNLSVVRERYAGRQPRALMETAQVSVFPEGFKGVSGNE